MSSGTEAGLPEPDGLQFDHAEFEQAPPASVACASCKQPIADHYFEINGTVVCEPCKAGIDTRLFGGSMAGRLLKAGLYGSGAGVVGALIYFLVIVVTHMDLALISILVGYLVGRMVRKGSGGLGGLPFQGLAVALTYLAICLTYFLMNAVAIRELLKQVPEAVPFPWVPLIQGSLAAPVMQVRESPITIAIIGFGLWQAWKMNRRWKLTVTGPYRVGEADPGGAMSGAPAHA